MENWMLWILRLIKNKINWALWYTEGRITLKWHGVTLHTGIKFVGLLYLLLLGYTSGEYLRVFVLEEEYMYVFPSKKLYDIQY